MEIVWKATPAVLGVGESRYICCVWQNNYCGINCWTGIFCCQQKFTLSSPLSLYLLNLRVFQEKFNTNVSYTFNFLIQLAVLSNCSGLFIGSFFFFKSYSWRGELMELIPLSIEDRSAMLKDSQLGKDFLHSWQIRHCGIIKGLASTVFLWSCSSVCEVLNWL